MKIFGIYFLCFQEDKALVKKMREANEAELAKLEAEIANAEKNEGESELKDAWQKKAEYLTKVNKNPLLFIAPSLL